MAWTTNDLNALEASIAQGATSVKYADKQVEYRSLEDMLQLRDAMKNELGLNGPDPTRGQRRFASFSKGL